MLSGPEYGNGWAESFSSKLQLLSITYWNWLQSMVLNIKADWTT